MTTVSLIVATSQNNVIGRDNDLIWHIPEDLKRFKALTFGKPCIMGRKTFESIVNILGKPLPGRTSIIVSRSGYSYEGCISATSLDDAVENAKGLNTDEIFIAGGAQIYKQSLDQGLIDKIYLTCVEQDFEGDAYFPELDMGSWTIEEDNSQGTNPSCRFMTLVRA